MFPTLSRTPPGQSDRVKRKAMAAESRKPTARGSFFGDSNGDFYDSVRRFWQKSYAGDYLGLAGLVTAYVLFKLVDAPFHHQFRLDDMRIQHPFAEVERVPPCTSFSFVESLPE
jgi:diacylglycerol diphosphate phosphatase/phosphatidate phosphatase